jgi:hypothetical protein
MSKYFFGASFFSKKDPMLFFIQILGRRRPVGQDPLPNFLDSRLAALVS